MWSTVQADQPIPGDVGVIKIDDGFIPQNNKNQLLTKETPNEANGGLGTVDSKALFSSHFPGVTVCSFGAGSAVRPGVTGKRCGTILFLSTDNKTCMFAGEGEDSEPCAKLAMTFEVSYDSTGGDSGGPYWFGPSSSGSPWTAVGMHTHSHKDNVNNPDDPSRHGWYVPISTQLNALTSKGIAVTLCVNANCN